MLLMKIQIDTEARTVKIEGPESLGQLFDFLERLLPDQWREYRLEPHRITDWINPIIIERERPVWPNPYQWPHTVWTTSTTANIELQ